MQGCRNQRDGFLSLAPVWRDGEVREISGVLPVIKRDAFTQRTQISPRNACRVVVTAKSGRFLEFFLETLKRPGRMSRTPPSSNGPQPEGVPTGMRRHADAGAPSDRSDLKPPWLTASGQTAILLHFRGGEGDSIEI